MEDEVNLLDAGSKVSWVAGTKANVEVNGNKAHFMRNGKHFYMQIIAPAGAVFKTYPAKNTYKGEKLSKVSQCLKPNVHSKKQMVR